MRVGEIVRGMIVSFIQDRPKKLRSGREVTVTPEGTHYHYKGQKVATAANGTLTLLPGSKGSGMNSDMARLMRAYGMKVPYRYPHNKGWGPTHEPYPLVIDIQTAKILSHIPVDKYVKRLLLARDPHSLHAWIRQCEEFGLLTEELKDKIAAKRVAYRLAEAV